MADEQADRADDADATPAPEGGTDPTTPVDESTNDESAAESSAAAAADAPTVGEVETSTAAADDAPTHDGGAQPARPGRARRILVALAVIAACVLAPLSVMVVWTKTTLLDTDKYVSTVSPLATNQAIIEAGANRLTDAVMNGTDVAQRLQDALPPRAAKAAPAMTAAIRNVVNNAATKLLTSKQFATVWEEANRRAQPQVVALLTGNATKRGVKLEGDTVVLDLSPLAKKVEARIQSLGLDISSRKPTINTKIELFDASFLTPVQGGVDLLQKLAWLLPVLTLLLFGLAIGFSPNRRRTVLRSGFGLSLGMLFILTALKVGRTPYLDLFQRADGRRAGAAAYDQLLHDLKMEVRMLFVLGLVIVLGAWLAGPHAVRLRGMVTGRERSSEPSELAAWVGRSKTGLRAAVFVIAGIVLVAIDQLSGWDVVLVAVLVLVALAVIELVGRSGPAPTPTEVEAGSETDTETEVESRV